MIIHTTVIGLCILVVYLLVPTMFVPSECSS